MPETVIHGLTFRIGQQWYALNVDRVIEVIHLVALAELPAAESKVLGLMTLRDRVLPVIDLRSYMGIPDPQYTLTTPIIAVHSERTAFGMVVDEVDNVERILPEQLNAYSGPNLAQISGVARLNGRLLFLIDLAAIDRSLSTSAPELAYTLPSAS